MRKCKWLLFVIYHPPSQCDKHFFDSLSRGLAIYSALYDKFVLIGDFNRKESENNPAYFLNCHNASNRVRDKICFKSLSNLSCIDLIITNKPGCSQNTIVTSISLSDCHKFVTTILQAFFTKALPKEVFYRDYKHYNNKDFKNDLHTKLGALVKDYDIFENTFLEILNVHAPAKKRFL